MGAINYYTSDYITIGYNCNNINYDDNYYNDDINYLYDEIQEILKDYNFYYFNVKLKPGYYEGFSIDIEFNFGYCLDSYQDKKDALKEVTQIKKFLLDCINDFNLCAISPGWCTTYYNYKDSINKLQQAIKEMRAHVINTPTYYKLKLANEI